MMSKEVTITTIRSHPEWTQDITGVEVGVMIRWQGSKRLLQRVLVPMLSIIIASVDIIIIAKI